MYVCMDRHVVCMHIFLSETVSCMQNRGAPINREPVAFPTTATQLIRQRQSSSASVIARLQFFKVRFFDFSVTGDMLCHLATTV